jgi:hypothetical protein
MNKQEQKERIKKIILERGVDTASEWIALELEGAKEVIRERNAEILAIREALNKITELDKELPAYKNLEFVLASTVLADIDKTPVVEHVAKGTIIKFSSYMIISFTAENGDPFRYSISLNGDVVTVENLYRDGEKRLKRTMSSTKAKTDIKMVTGDSENA